MPPRPLPFREVTRRLEAAGFSEVSQRGRHAYIRRSEAGVRTVIVPLHREVAEGTLRSILRQAGLLRDDFDRL